MNQQTIGSPFTLSGVGIHTGAAGRIVVRPAEEGTGRRFRIGGVLLPASIEYVVDTRRCTSLGVDGIRISTVEHLLSALAGCGVDNCEIETEGPEIPILDGSSLPFVEAILSVGITAQAAPAKIIRLREPILVSANGSEMAAAPADALSYDVTTVFEDWPEGSVTVTADSTDGIPSGYRDTIAPARTFAFRREVEMLIAAGLAKGGSLDNALIIEPPNTYSSPLRVASEWCAHKLLDLIGDLALLDARLAMKISVIRPGHTTNTALANAILGQSRGNTD
jgi:UDP-3-O-[3-hydroxymyristoyl] N-acetylglucosamine deacetylase